MFSTNSINDCPVEVLLEIFFALRPEVPGDWWDQEEPKLGDILSLMQCNQKLANVGLSVLWESIFITNPTTLRLITDTLFNTAQIPKDLDLFPLRGAMHFRDNRAELVKCLFVSVDIITNEMPAFRRLLWEMTELQMLGVNSAILSISEPQPQRADTPTPFTWPISRDLTVQDPQQLRFKKLDSVFLFIECGIRAPVLQVSVLNSLQMLGFPPVKTFHGQNIWDYAKSPQLEEDLQLTDLSLERSNLPRQTMDDILSHCPDLLYLTYEHAHRAGRPFFPGAFAESIKHLSSLQALTLLRPEDALDHDDWGELHEGEFEIIKSLAAFKNLTHLSISAHLLLGPQDSRGLLRLWDGNRWFQRARDSVTKSLLDNQVGFQIEQQDLLTCLPASLEHLHLAACGRKAIKDLTPFLLQLATVTESPTPKLKSILLDFYQGSEWANLGTLGEFETFYEHHPEKILERDPYAGLDDDQNNTIYKLLRSYVGEELLLVAKLCYEKTGIQIVLQF